MKRCVLPVFFFISIFSDIVAQQHKGTYDKFIAQDGLPNNNIRCLYKDSKGYLWVGTSNGLAKFDGFRFSVFQHSPNSSSVSGHVIQSVSEDGDGNIWVAANGLSKYDRKANQWHCYITEAPKAGNIRDNLFSGLYKQNDSVFWASSVKGLHRFCTKSEEFQFFPYPNKNTVVFNPFVPSYSKEFLILGIRSNNWKLDFKTGEFEDISFKPKGNFGSLLLHSDSVQIVNIQDKLGEGWSFYYSNAHLIRLGKTLTYNFQGLLFNNTLGVFIDSSLQFVDMKGEMLEKIPLGAIINDNENFEVTCALREDNGTLWLGTNEGLYKFGQRLKFNSIGHPQGLEDEYVRSLCFSNNDLLAGLYRANPVIIKNIEKSIGNNKTAFIAIESINNPKHAYSPVNGISLFPNQQAAFLGRREIAVYDLENKREANRINLPNAYQFWASDREADTLWVGTISDNSLLKFRIAENKLLLDTMFNQLNCVLSFFLDSDGTLWIGGEGLYRLNRLAKNNYEFEQFLPPYDTLAQRFNPVWNILEYDSLHLLLGTTENGLFLLNKQTRKYQSFSAKFNTNNVICGMVSDINNNIWISTMEGLHCYHRATDELFKYTIADGLVSDDFNFKAVAKSPLGWLFFGTKKGIVYFHPDSLNNKAYDANLFVNEFRVQDRIYRTEVGNGEIITLSNRQNFFSIEFALLDLNNAKSTEYEYMLKGYDNAVRRTNGKNPLTNYTNVPPGDYIFNLKAFTKDKMTQRGELAFAIIIKPAYYQTVLFKIWVVLTIVALVVFVFIQLYRKQLLKGRLYKLELDFLRAQINPHFIFNTLNSIQHYIMNNEKMLAFDYLSRFAKLMRSSLNYSRIEYHSLSSTIDFFRNHVKLESLNLNEEIVFEATIVEPINADTYFISPMLIQPFIENAVLHGLSAKNHDMRLELTFEIEEKNMKCTITDNGIGREAAAKIGENKKKNHHSMGIEISKQAIMLQMKQSKRNPDCIDIIDNFDNTGNPTGTTVVLKMKYFCKNESSKHD
jgi:ligand-binding sensor domain-containing protein